MSFQKSISRDMRHRRDALINGHVARRLHGELPKQSLQEMLAEAAKNTAAIQVDHESARILSPLLKGRRN